MGRNNFNRLKIFKNLLLVVAFVIGLFGALRFGESERLKRLGDELIKESKPEEAIIVYEQAQNVFPWRPDLTESLNGARLIWESDLAYGQIYQIGAEIQELPPLEALPPIQPLKAGELFVPVLMYHHIRVNPRPNDPVWAALNVSTEQLDSQLQYLDSHNFHTVTLDELFAALSGKGTLPANPIVLTFDDGYRTLYESAFPLLKKYHMKAVAFVITGVVGTAPYLTWDQIGQMDKSGLVQLAAHTRHHPNLPELSKSAIVDEIVGSKKDLETYLRHPIRWFAYPYGSYSNFIIQTVKDAGFVGAASTIYGTVANLNNIYLLPRVMVDGRFTLDNLARRITRQ